MPTETINPTIPQLPKFEVNDLVEVYPGQLGRILSPAYYAMPNGGYYLEVELQGSDTRNPIIYAPYSIMTWADNEEFR
jgi:hypothetical protein